MVEGPAHEHLFPPAHVALARSQARHVMSQPDLYRPCVLCGAQVELLGPARAHLAAGRGEPTGPAR